MKFCSSLRTKENKATLGAVCEPTSWTASQSCLKFFNAYLTSSSSCFQIACIPPNKVCSELSVFINSKAWSRETAPTIFGVPASNFWLFFWRSNPEIVTSLIVPPQTMRGSSSLIRWFFKTRTQSQVWAIILWAVNANASAPISWKSIEKFGTDWEPSTKKKVSFLSLDLIFLRS